MSNAVRVIFRRTLSFLILAAVCLVPGVGAARPARAAVTDHVLNIETNRCIDDSFAYGLRAFPCNGLAFQTFDVIPQPDGRWVLRNRATARCIDDSLAYGLRAFPCNNLSFQAFAPRKEPAGFYELRNKATGRCIDDSYAYGLRAFPCNNLSFQRFWL
jgi:hypothetical protein